ncbi:uncharacterized protein LOC144883149 [Branchiostoma floridae x Branchiostoma japonicum]
MKREGGSVSWTAPQQCKRSRLCVSTVGSQDSRLRLVLHFRGTSSSLTPPKTVDTTPGSLKKSSLTRPEVQHGKKKSCLDRKVNGKIFKMPKVDSKGKSDAKKKQIQQKSLLLTTSKTVETAPGSLKKTSLTRPEGEHGKKSCLDKQINGKIFKTPQVENEDKSDDKKIPTQQKSLLLTLSKHADTGDTERTYSDYNTTHCRQTKNIVATCRETSRRDHRNSEVARSTKTIVKHNGFQTPKKFSPHLDTRNPRKPGVKRTPKQATYHKVTHHSSSHCSGPVEESDGNTIKSEQKPLLQEFSHVGVETAVEDSRHSKWYVSPISGTRSGGKQIKGLEEKRFNQEVELTKVKTIPAERKRCNQEVELTKVKTVSEVQDVKVAKAKTMSAERKRCNQDVKLTKAKTVSAIQDCLFPTCPWELDNDSNTDVATQKLNPSSDRKETKEEQAEEEDKQETVCYDQQLSKVQLPAGKLQGKTYKRTIEPKVHHKNISCAKAEVAAMLPSSSTTCASDAKPSRCDVEVLKKKAKSNELNRKEEAKTLQTQSSLAVNCEIDKVVCPDTCTNIRKTQKQQDLVDSGTESDSIVCLDTNSRTQEQQDSGDIRHVKTIHVNRSENSVQSNEAVADTSVNINSKECAKRSPEQIKTVNCLRAKGHKIEEAGGATRHENTSETGRSKKGKSPKKGQEKSAGKSPEGVIINCASLHEQQRLQKDWCKEENIVETLQNKLVIAKDCDNTRDFNRPIRSADTSDIIDDVISSTQNGPITERKDSSEDVSPVPDRMKQTAVPVNSPRKFDLEVADLVTLAPQEWLNDNVINGYFELLAEVRPDVYCFNTFFYTQLCRKGYQGVKRWTKKVQIFEKSLLLVPLHLGNHWCLAEVSVADKLLFLYDSRGGAYPTCLQRLVSYLCCEAKERGEADFTWGWGGHCKEDIPVQETSGDCGVFVCQYARCIVEGRRIDFSQDDITELRCHMTQELLQHKLL